MQLKYDEVIERIIKERGLSLDEIEGLVEKKLVQLNGLISKEGAVHIIAHELGIKLFENVSSQNLKIKDILSGMRFVGVTGKVLRLNDVVHYKKQDREGKVASFLVGDETGIIRIVFWDTEHIKEIEDGNLKEGSILKLRGAYVKENNGFKELHLSNRGSFIINPENVEINNVKEIKEYGKKLVKDLIEGDIVEISGTIVQAFEPNFYDVCEKCSRKVINEEGNYICNEHGKVNAKKAPVMNVFLDDGTSSIRVVCFKNQAERLLNLKSEEMPEKFDGVKSDVLGKQIGFAGRVVKNSVMDRVEFIAQRVMDINPQEKISELMKEISI